MPCDDIKVRFPDFYWLADPNSFPSLTQDPDERDGNPPRFSDKDQINWRAVGEAAALVGKLLVTKQYEVDEEDPEFAIVKCDLSALSPEERKIVFRWFCHGVSVCGDYPDLENGRHRLWNCWSAAPSLLLPVESSFLCATCEPEDSSIWQQLPCWAFEKLSRVPQEVLDRSPLYAEKLNKLAKKCVETETDAITATTFYEPDQLSEYSLEDTVSGSIVDCVKRFFKEIFD